MEPFLLLARMPTMVVIKVYLHVIDREIFSRHVISVLITAQEYKIR